MCNVQLLQVCGNPLFLISLAVVMSCLKESASHMGPLYWFPDKCCLIPGHEPAASPSFLHTTLRKRRKRVSIVIVLFHTGVYMFFVFFLREEIYEDKEEYKTRDKIFTRMSSKIKWNVMQVSKSWELLNRQECYASLAIRVKITEWYANLHWLWADSGRPLGIKQVGPFIFFLKLSTWF